MSHGDWEASFGVSIYALPFPTQLSPFQKTKRSLSRPRIHFDKVYLVIESRRLLDLALMRVYRSGPHRVQMLSTLTTTI